MLEQRSQQLQPLRCALCHDALAEEELEVEAVVRCPSCGTQLHADCADEVALCPTLACHDTVGTWSFGDAMWERDGDYVRVGVIAGGALGSFAGLAFALVSADIAPELYGFWRICGTTALGAAQGAILATFALFLLRELLGGTPPLRPDPEPGSSALPRE